LKEGIVLFVLLGVLITLSVFLPFELGEKANPLQTPHAIKPEWYFLSMYQVLKYFPKLIGVFVIGLAPFFLLIWPFLDKTPERRPSKRPVSMTIGILVVLSLVIFGVLGYVSESKIQAFGKTYDIDMYGKPHLIPTETPSGQKDVHP
jgi:quinol-cytochrome oxidoreductase complex cytochrome b subunit